MNQVYQRFTREKKVAFQNEVDPVNENEILQASQLAQRTKNTMIKQLGSVHMFGINSASFKVICQKMAQYYKGFQRYLLVFKLKLRTIKPNQTVAFSFTQQADNNVFINATKQFQQDNADFLKQIRVTMVSLLAARKALQGYDPASIISIIQQSFKTTLGISPTLLLYTCASYFIRNEYHNNIKQPASNDDLSFYSFSRLFGDSNINGTNLIVDSLNIGMPFPVDCGVKLVQQLPQDNPTSQKTQRYLQLAKAVQNQAASIVNEYIASMQPLQMVMDKFQLNNRSIHQSFDNRFVLVNELVEQQKKTVENVNTIADSLQMVVYNQRRAVDQIGGLTKPVYQGALNQHMTNVLLQEQFATKFPRIQPIDGELLKQFPQKVQAQMLYNKVTFSKALLDYMAVVAKNVRQTNFKIASIHTENAQADTSQIVVQKLCSDQAKQTIQKMQNIAIQANKGLDVLSTRGQQVVAAKQEGIQSDDTGTQNMMIQQLTTMVQGNSANLIKLLGSNMKDFNYGIQSMKNGFQANKTKLAEFRQGIQATLSSQFWKLQQGVSNMLNQRQRQMQIINYAVQQIDTGFRDINSNLQNVNSTLQSASTSFQNVTSTLLQMGKVMQQIVMGIKHIADQIRQIKTQINKITVSVDKGYKVTKQILNILQNIGPFQHGLSQMGYMMFDILDAVTLNQQASSRWVRDFVKSMRQQKIQISKDINNKVLQSLNQVQTKLKGISQTQVPKVQKFASAISTLSNIPEYDTHSIQRKIRGVRTMKDTLSSLQSMPDYDTSTVQRKIKNIKGMKEALSSYQEINVSNKFVQDNQKSIAAVTRLIQLAKKLPGKQKVEQQYQTLNAIFQATGGRDVDQIIQKNKKLAKQFKERQKLTASMDQIYKQADSGVRQYITSTQQIQQKIKDSVKQQAQLKKLISQVQVNYDSQKFKNIIQIMKKLSQNQIGTIPLQRITSLQQSIRLIGQKLEDLNVKQTFRGTGSGSPNQPQDTRQISRLTQQNKSLARALQWMFDFFFKTMNNQAQYFSNFLMELYDANSSNSSLKSQISKFIQQSVESYKDSMQVATKKIWNVEQLSNFTRNRDALLDKRKKVHGKSGQTQYIQLAFNWWDLNKKEKRIR